MVGRIERIPLREVWKHEAQDFTTWLVENTEVLSETLGFTLKNPERERRAGDFVADLTAQDDGGNIVVIENQFTKSDHDHLGKIITYVSVLNARIAIWIVPDPRQEHVQAVISLNKARFADFYLLKIEAVRIGNSEPASLLTLITSPSEPVREITEEIAERLVLRRRFWETLLNRAKAKTKLHSGISPSDDSWLAAGAGKSGLAFQYRITQHACAVEFVIDRGKGAEAEVETKDIFDKLQAQQVQIGAAFGDPLDWRQQEGVRSCRIRFAMSAGGYRDDESVWPNIQDAMIDSMFRLEKALRPFLG
jgi:Domain of unknown function (DUF4268)